MAAAQPHAQTVAVRDRELVYREWGTRSAPTLVYWPGLNPFGALELIEAGPVWADVHGLHVIAFSAPGLGDSPRLADAHSYRPRQLASLLVGALDALALDRVAFAGFSWGAHVGIHLAVQSPNRIGALILLDGGYSDPQDDPGFSERTLEEVEAETRRAQDGFRFAAWEQFIDAMTTRRRLRPALETRYRAGMAEEAGEIRPRSDPAVAAAVLHGLALQPAFRELRRLARTGMPVLLLVSSRSVEETWARESLARFRRELPTATVELVADTGHDLLADAPTVTTELVADWLCGGTSGLPRA